MNMIVADSDVYYDGYSYYDSYWWEDQYSGKKSEIFWTIVDEKGNVSNPDASEQRWDDMAKHKSKVYQELKDKMQDPEATAICESS